MQFSTLLALAALAIGQVAAGTLNHRHFHMRREAHGALDVESIEKRDVLSASSLQQLTKIGALPGTNAASSSGGLVWLGNDGPYTNDFQNNSTEPIILAIWGPAGSWVGAIKPLITVSLPPGAVQTVSFASGASGAWSAIYPETTLTQYGQIGNTWGEYTFAGQWSTFDVSREVAMNGRAQKIVSPKCVSDMSTCVFVCTDGSNSCLTAYTLQNCAAGSQPGAQTGTYAGAASGGCSGLTDTGKLQTYFY